MRLSRALISAAVLSVAAVAARAEAFIAPVYSHMFTPAPAMTLTAISTGDVTGVYVSSNAGGEDTVRLFDVTANTYSPWLLDNRTTTAGAVANFGHVNAGDRLVFEIHNNDLGAGSYYVLYQGGAPDPILASDSAYSVDGDSHAFATSYGAGTVAGLGAFTFLGMEDLPAVASDFDYNDLDFEATNVTTGQVPEPSSMVLLSTGLIGVGQVVRRKLRA